MIAKLGKLGSHVYGTTSRKSRGWEAKQKKTKEMSTINHNNHHIMAILYTMNEDHILICNHGMTHAAAVKWITTTSQ